ncbi:MAG: glycine zipper family protein [Gammaproteobacteria bacterium]|nr:glycine zipper family protein [Gammaproteobacteria bacterium]
MSRYSAAYFRIIATASLGFLSACASQQPNIIIDTHGVDMAGYEQDLAYCEQFQNQVQGQTGKEAAKGAVVGGATGAIWSGSDGAGKGAASGLIIGAMRGTEQKSREKVKVVKNCLRNKGYKILN